MADEERARLEAAWPLFALRVRTPRLELRYPTDADLLALGDVAGDIHAPDERPFGFAWNDTDDLTRRRRILQHHWEQRGAFSPADWHLNLVTVVDGEVVGTQGVFATAFLVGRTVHTGSWLTRRCHGQGLGTEMRAAVLHLAFEGLGALRAETGALDGNPASIAVTTRNGYRPNGERIHVDGDRRRIEQRFVLDRADWEARRRGDIELLGLEPCLPLFGLGAPRGDAVD
jgi:RimJ/RimL family protein N-acetyltransferase